MPTNREKVQQERAALGFVRTGQGTYDLRWVDLCGNIIPPSTELTIIYRFAVPNKEQTIYSRGTDYTESAVYNTLDDCQWQRSPIWKNIRETQNVPNLSMGHSGSVME